MSSSEHRPDSLGSLWTDYLAPGELQQILSDPAQALPVGPVSRRDVWDRRTGSADRLSLEDISQRARADRGETWPQLTASLWSAYVRHGNRASYEDIVYSRTERLSRAVIAALVTQETVWLDEISDGVMLLCEQSTWCWSAHDDSHRQKEWMVPDTQEPFLDLGAGEVAAQLAWIDHLLGAELDLHLPGLRARIRREVRQRVLDPYMQRRDWHWLLRKPPNNWMPWVCGNVCVAALLLLDRPEEQQYRAQIVSQTIDDVDRYLAVLPADGAIDEGASYWWAGAGRLLEMLELLHHASSGVLDASGLPTIKELVAFLHRMNLGKNWCLAVADGNAKPSLKHSWDLLHRWARLVGDTEAARYAASYRQPGVPVVDETRGMGRLMRRITDQAWIHCEPLQYYEPKGSTWLPSVQILLAHQHTGEDRLSLAVKGGHNQESHNHNDVGQVVIALNGVPALVDPGRPTYTGKTFGKDRYTLWPMQSLWHNVPVIRGQAQQPGEEYAATDIHLSPDRRGMELDIHHAYPVPEVKQWRRSASHTDQGIQVTDTWDLAAAPHPAGATQWHWILAGEVHLVQPGIAVVTPIEGDRQLQLNWEPGLRAQVESKPLEDPKLSEVWGTQLTRLVIDLPVGDEPSQGSSTLHISVADTAAEDRKSTRGPGTA